MPTGSIYSLGYSQWFVNCAHVNIVGPGGGVPGPMTRFPEAYNGTIDASINLQYPGAKNEFEGIANYPEPGAARWNGE